MEIAQAHSKHQRLEERNIEGDIWHKHQWNPSSLWCVRLDKICQLKLTLCHLLNVYAYTCMCVFSMKSLKTNGYATTDLTRRVRFDIPLPIDPYHSSIGIQESFTFVIMCVKRNSRRCWLLAVCIGKTARTRLRCIASLSVSYSWTNLVEEGARRLYLKTIDMSLGVNFINYLVTNKSRYF